MSNYDNLYFDENTPIDFMRLETYNGKETPLVAFSNGGFEFNGSSIAFSNMATYPIMFKGNQFSSPETAYIAGYYGSNTDDCIRIQREIQAMNNALLCKRLYRKKEINTIHGRTDFHQSIWHFNLMLYLVWEKCKAHPEFRKILLAIPDRYAIIESQNPFPAVKIGDWGCKNLEALKAYKQRVKELEESGSLSSKIKIKNQAVIDTWNIGTWEGCNHQGKILMACRKALRTKTQPCIDYAALNEAQIYLFGQLLEF